MSSCFSVGQRSAREPVSHLLLLLFDRAKVAGQTSSNRAKLPRTQHHLSDALGLSLAHTNKTLRGLVKDGFLKWRAGELELSNIKQLAELSSYTVDHPTPRPII